MAELRCIILDKPHNPLLNSGAIMSSALLLNLVKPDMPMSEKFDLVMQYFGKMAGMSDHMITTKTTKITNIFFF